MDGLRFNRAARVYISLSRSPFSLAEKGREREREKRRKTGGKEARVEQEEEEEDEGERCIFRGALLRF